MKIFSFVARHIFTAVSPPIRVSLKTDVCVEDRWTSLPGTDGDTNPRQAQPRPSTRSSAGRVKTEEVRTEEVRTEDRPSALVHRMSRPTAASRGRACSTPDTVTLLAGRRSSMRSEEKEKQGEQ